MKFEQELNMFILRMQHPVPDFEMWKREGFDRDPLDRKGSGVRSYTVSQPVDDPKSAMIDLTFNSLDEAEAMLVRLKEMWEKVGSQFGWEDSPRTKIVEVVEEKVLSFE